MVERLTVVWRVTTRCNLSCAFCAYDRALPFERVDAEESSVRALGRSLAERANVHVSFLGGEPLLWEPLPRVARHFRELGLSLGITTNGVSLAGASTRALVLDCIDELTLSIDGLGNVHDTLRGWPGGFQRLSAVLRDVQREKVVRGRGPLLRVNTVLMHDNIAAFPELCRTLAELGVQELTFNRLGGRDRPEFFPEHRLHPSELERFAAELPALRRELSTRGLGIRGGRGYVERLLSLERGEREAVHDCEPGERFLFVDERGTLAPCSFTLESYGERARELSDLPRRFLVRQRSQRAVACDDCASTRVFEKFGAA